MTQRAQPESIVDPEVLDRIAAQIKTAKERLERYRAEGEPTETQEAAMNRLIDDWHREAGL